MTEASAAPPLILASTSPYRRELLGRLAIPFSVIAPDVDEGSMGPEAPGDRALRLALDKARAVAAHWSDAIVIGSDQVASLDGTVLNKPGAIERATDQLRSCSGRIVNFHTAVAVVHGVGDRALAHSAVSRTRVRFRKIDDAEIGRYLRLDEPWDCAGAFKVEGAGPSLFRWVESDDPTALVGLPLTATAELLRRMGLNCP